MSNTQVAPLQIPHSAASDSSTAPSATQNQQRIASTSNATVSTQQASQGTSTESSITPSATPSQQQSSAWNEAAAPATSDDSAMPDSATLASQPGFSFISSTISFSDPTTTDAATGDLTVSAQIPADPTTADAAPTFAVPQTGSTSSEVAAVVDTWAKKSTQTQAPVAEFPFSAGSVQNKKSQTIPPAAGWAVPALQTTANTVVSSAADPGARQQKLPARNSAANTRSEVSPTAPTTTPHPMAASNAPTTGTSKTQVAATPTLVSASPTSDAIWSIPTPAGNSATLNSLKPSAVNVGNDDSNGSNLIDKTSTDSSTGSDQSASSGSDDDSRPAISQTTLSATTSGLFAPVTIASSMSPSTQTISLASALKQDPSVAASGGMSSSRGDAASDTQLPSAVVMHRAAEAAELSAGLQAWNGGDNAQTRMVQSARLGGNLGSSEMNVSLRAEGLGAVELRTHVTGDTVGASINVERHDAHAMLSNDLGSLHQALNDRQLRVGDVKVFQGAFGSDATAADNQSSQRRDMAPQQHSTNWTSGSSTSFAGATATADRSDANIFFDSSGRLSVRA
jgi:Flagellar hook-length control protein FliK